MLGAGVLAVVALTRMGSGDRAGVISHGTRAHTERALTQRHPRSPTARSIERVLAYTPFISVGSARKREIALTFDDGPGPYTPQLITILRRYRVPATFFVVGQSLDSFGASLAKELREGFPIGDHTENHRPLAMLSEKEQRSQLTDQAFRVHSYGAPYPRLFRPPYRSFNRTTLALARKLHMLMVLWTVDSLDYRQPGVRAIVTRVLGGARPGAIILMHDAGGRRTQTLAALPTIIKGLRRALYRLVTVPRVLPHPRPAKGQPGPAGAG